MASQTLDTLIFKGSLNGTVTVQAQPIAGDAILQLPNIVGTVGQNLQIVGITGPELNILQLGFVTPAAGGVSTISLSQITQSGATTGQTIKWSGSAWVPTSTVPGDGTVTSVATAGIATGGPITASGTVTVLGSGNTTTAATAAANLAAAVVNHVLTADGHGNVQDSGTLLASLTPVYTTDTNKQAIRIKPSTTIGTFSPSEPIAASLIVYSDAVASVAILQTGDGQGYFWSDPNGCITIQSQIAGTKAAVQIMQPADQPALVAKLTAGVGTHNVFEAWGILAGSPSVSVDSTGALNFTTATSSTLFSLTSTTGVGVINTTSGDIAITQNGSGNITASVSSTSRIQLNTATGVFEFFGNGGGMSLQTQNASIAIDATGNVSIGAASGQTVSFSGQTVVDNSAGTQIGLLVHGNSTADIARFETGNSAAAFQVTNAGDAFLRHHLITDNTGIAGVVTITNPATTQAVVYDTPFTGAAHPNVTATAVGADPSTLGGVWITHQGSASNWTGFTINVTTTPSVSAIFSYTIIGS